MCFDEKTSWITLGIGTSINIGIAVYLYQEYNKTKNKNAFIALMLLGVWQFALLMQLPDALAWNSLKNNSTTPSYIGKTAYILNISQPVVSFLVLYFIYNFLGLSKIILIPVFILLLIYLAFVLNFLYEKPNFNIAPTKSCHSLDYHWWNKGIRGILYFTTMLVILVLIPGIKWKIANIAIFVLSFIFMSLSFKTCNVSSLWCWSIAPAGIIILLTYLLNKNNN